MGDDPLAIAVNSVTNRVYVLNTTSGTVSVLDGKTDAVVATVNVGKWPYVLAANPAENKVYVSNIFSNVITIIDGVTNTTKTVSAGSADAIAIDPLSLIHISPFSRHRSRLRCRRRSSRHTQCSSWH